MTGLEKFGLVAIIAAALFVLGYVLYLEHVGYCISDYTCTENITPKAFRGRQ